MDAVYYRGHKFSVEEAPCCSHVIGLNRPQQGNGPDGALSFSQRYALISVTRYTLMSRLIDQQGPVTLDLVWAAGSVISNTDRHAHTPLFKSTALLNA